MNRRWFLRSLGVSMFAAPLVGEAQQATKVWRIGCILTGTSEGVGHLPRAIETSLSSRGYVQGRNVTLVQRVAPPDPEQAEAVVRALVPALDLLIVGGTVGGVAAKRAMTTLPTVFLGVGDPVHIGLVSSLAHPGGNMTGVTFEASTQTYGKRLQLLKEIVPTLAVAGILRPTGDPNIAVAMQSLEQVAPVLGVRLRSFDVSRVEDLPNTFAAMRRGGVQGVVVVAGAFTYSHGPRIAELALASRLPLTLPFRETVLAGGLISLGPDLVAMAAQVAADVDKIIQGAKPGDLPVEQPARYEIYVNLKTAKALGLTVPPSLLERADQVIQ